MYADDSTEVLVSGAQTKGRAAISAAFLAPTVTTAPPTGVDSE